jgi:hypothetical protein
VKIDVDQVVVVLRGAVLSELEQETARQLAREVADELKAEASS